MNGSLRLFTVAGIEIRVHVTFPLILAWVAFSYGVSLGLGWRGAGFGIIATLMLFVVVVMHELGHSFAALAYGIPVRRIVLLPIGGVAELGRLPERPSQELVVAVAGPAVNVVLAVVFAVIAMATPLGAGAAIGGASLELPNAAALQDPARVLFQYVAGANLALLVFNLAPAFPLDGGRVLRALLAMRFDFARATGWAVSVGQTLAWLLGLAGLYFGNVMLVVVAVFIHMAGGQEGRFVQVRHVLRRVQVRHAYARQAAVLAPDEPLNSAIALTLGSLQADFPVVAVGKVVGMLTAADVIEALQRNRGDALVAELMHADVPVAAPSDSLFEAQERMLAANLNALPVVQAGSFVGLLTLRDVTELYQMLTLSPHLLDGDENVRRG